MKTLVTTLLLSILPLNARAQLSTESSWRLLTEKQKDAAMKFADAYKAFIAEARTELQTVKQVTQLAKAAGFRQLTSDSEWRPGARYFDINRDRTICLIVAGKQKLSEGARIIAGHIDSPRLEVKARPLYGREGVALFQTVYHGGIKKYQWANIPLALVGRIDKTDGTILWVDIGTTPGDPIFLIPDLAPHVDRDLRNRTAAEALKGEELDPIVGSIPAGTASVKQSIMDYLARAYDMTEADFISAELALVPAVAPSDLGFDRGLVAAYGQDDRLCSYVAVRASIDSQQPPPYTTISYLVDNEESGSNNNTGARSDYLRGLLHRLLSLEKGPAVTELDVRKMLPKILVLSADVTTGIHPQFASVQEGGNASRLSHGVVIKRYGRGNDPNSEFTARFRKILESNSIPYQTHTYKVDVGGGGTIGGFMSRENMEVLDCGVAILSMHSPYSLSSKVDIWSFYRACTAFYQQ